MGLLLLSFIIFVCHIPNIRTNEEEPSTFTTAFPLSTRFQRIRNQRLSMVRNYVLRSLGFVSPPVLDRDDVNHNRPFMIQEAIDEFQRKIQENRCYLPSCALPSRIDSALWESNSSKTMNLFFDPLSFNDEDVEVVNATLKLYVNSQGFSLRNRRIIVSVLQFMKPLKPRKKKKIKLMDVKMVSLTEEGFWITFNVTEAASDWLSDARKNNGFLVKIRTFANGIHITNIFGEPECEALPDIECDSSGIPFLFQLSSKAVLEIYTQKNAFTLK